VAKNSITEREKKRLKLVEKFRSSRNELKKRIKSATDFQVSMEYQQKLAKLPLNSNPIRLSGRCQCCGRGRGVYRKFKLCRICLRNHLMIGDVTGGRKSSW
jgi:small subunit ribosomal protein S14